MGKFLRKLSRAAIVVLASGAAMAASAQGYFPFPSTELSGTCWGKNSGEVQASSVLWPTGTGWSMPQANLPFEPGYSNTVSVSSDTPFSSGFPGRWSSASTFTTMTALSGKTLNFMDQRHAANVTGTVTYTFATPLTKDEARVITESGVRAG